jgi:DNA-binding IclR family transcriptional regulator
MAVMMEDADVLPYHATSSGLAVLAFSPPAFQDRVLTAPLPRLTAATETDPARLRDRLAAIRAEGHATSAGGFEADVSSLAAPLFDAGGGCRGALAVAAPAQRMTPALAAAIRGGVLRAAAEITALWGGQVPGDVMQTWQRG